jgi:hypothetical protein
MKFCWSSTSPEAEQMGPPGRRSLIKKRCFLFEGTFRAWGGLNVSCLPGRPRSKSTAVTDVSSLSDLLQVNASSFDTERPGNNSA